MFPDLPQVRVNPERALDVRNSAREVRFAGRNDAVIAMLAMPVEKRPSRKYQLYPRPMGIGLT
jgi:hypothetical protein